MPHAIVPQVKEASEENHGFQLLLRSSQTDRASKQQLRHLGQWCSLSGCDEDANDRDFCDDHHATSGCETLEFVRRSRSILSAETDVNDLERRWKKSFVFGCKKSFAKVRAVLACKSTSRVVPFDTAVHHESVGNSQPLKSDLKSEAVIERRRTVTFADVVEHQTPVGNVLQIPHTVPDRGSMQTSAGYNVGLDSSKLDMSTASTTASSLDLSPEIEFSPTKPVLARFSRDKKINQLAKVTAEFCGLEFDAVVAEDQPALVSRMLTTLKSLSSHDVFWTDGIKQKELRYALLGLQEKDMGVINKIAKRSDEFCDSRSFRQAYEELCKARPWLQADKAGLDKLRDEQFGAFDANAYKFLPGPLVPSGGIEFTVMSFNILAGELGREKTHGYCDPEHLGWKYRRQKLLEGLRRALPDLLLFQEVQGTTIAHESDHFNDIKGALSEDGYEVGAYARLTSSNGVELGTGTKSNSKKKPHIGNAIFIRSQVWRRLDQGRISFAQLLCARCSENEAQRKRYAKGEQVAAWTKLLHVATQRTVVVVSVHIGANWRNPDTQVAQVDVMVKELLNIVKEGDSVIIGGDFNSMPSSGVYELLSTGHLPADHPDACPKDTEVQKLCDENGFHSHLSLSSAYAESEPEFTTMCGVSPGTPGALPFSGTLDYIWYSPQTLKLVPKTSLSMPTVEEAARENGGLPNSTIPSDHVPLGVAMTFTQGHGK